MRKVKQLLNNKSMKFFGDKNSKRWLKIAAFILIFLVAITFLYFCYWKVPDKAGGYDPNSKLSEEQNSQNLSEDLYGENDMDDPSPISDSTAGVSGIGLFVKIIISLMVVVILIYITVKLLKIFYRNKGVISSSNTKSTGLIEILESKNIAPNRSIHLVSVAGKYIIIGSSEKQVNYVSSISSKQYDQFRSKNNDVRPEMLKKRSFKDIFQDYFNNIGK